MPISPARTAAFDILMQIELQEAYAAELLHASRFTGLSPADHHLATELVMGVLRWRSLLDERIALHSSQKLNRLDLPVLTALRLAAYQLTFLDRIPSHAAVHESVELVKRARKRSAAPFVNAVLRKLASQRNLPSIADAKNASELAQISAHPAWLVERWVGQFGLEAAKQICAWDQHVPPTVVRLREVGAEAELHQGSVSLAPGKLLHSACIVSAGDIRQSLAFRHKEIAIQDEGSQLVALLVGQGTNILDCCAAPGGKTRTLADRNPNARILAADLHPHRARLIRQMAPAENVHVIAADTGHLPVTCYFDRVLADVPCSGTGTLARNPEIKWRLKPDDLPDLQRRQIAILQSAMGQVAPGGRLVYSTCSLEREENEDVIEKALAANSSFRLVGCRAELERLRDEGELAWQDLDALTKGPFLRTVPGIHPCDGFFAGILERN